jgi:hypothetical protein
MINSSVSTCCANMPPVITMSAQAHRRDAVPFVGLTFRQNQITRVDLVFLDLA